VLNGGKRLRPMFAYCGWRCVRSADGDDAMITAAASLELLHGCALIHDDVMDGSSTRRGRPSVHTAFTTMHANGGFTGDRHVFGTAAAIVVGDLLLSWADAMFHGAGFDAESATRARHVYDDMRQQVMAGQYLDVLVQARGAFSAEDALRVAKYKTSKYTVEGPLQFGAAAAGAPADIVEAISAYGLPLGEAFQLRDDVLGVFGDPDRTGKPSGDDLREGKQTMLVALAMDEADAGQAALLRSGLGDRGLTDDGVAAICNVIVATGALARVEARIAERTKQARTALAASAIAADARTVLDMLAVAATERHT
jgi:geranylgeranyl diphosphate synthase type I